MSAAIEEIWNEISKLIDEEKLQLMMDILNDLDDKELKGK